MHKKIKISNNPGDYYSLKEISEIILTDMFNITQAIGRLNEWDAESLYYFNNPICVDGETKYYYKIMAIFDKLINIENPDIYKHNYIKDITNNELK